MLTNTNTREVKFAILACGGLVALYGLLYGPISSLTVGGKDWVDAFRNGARGDFTLVATPYWSLLLSYLPSRLPDPIGYSVWIGIGALLLLVAAHYFRSPLFAVLFSYQLNWVLFYGQVDSYVVFATALGAFAIERARPFLIGIAISLLMIKPQVGLLLSLYFLWRSPYRMKTIFAFLLVALASIILWPGWPERYLTTQLAGFLQRPYNVLTNTSIGLPVWLALPVAALALLLPAPQKTRIQSLVAANLLISPYSTIYSQLSLLCLGLPPIFYVFGLLPWAIGILLGPFGHWQWAFLFPLLVLIYNLMAFRKHSSREASSALPGDTQ